VLPQHPGTHLQLLGPVLFLICDVFLLISVAALAIAQGSQVARNVTTNELANWHR
jgi:palmitoyltransferase